VFELDEPRKLATLADRTGSVGLGEAAFPKRDPSDDSKSGYPQHFIVCNPLHTLLTLPAHKNNHRQQFRQSGGRSSGRI